MNWGELLLLLSPLGVLLVALVFVWWWSRILLKARRMARFQLSGRVYYVDERCRYYEVDGAMITDLTLLLLFQTSATALAARDQAVKGSGNLPGWDDLFGRRRPKG